MTRLFAWLGPLLLGTGLLACQSPPTEQEKTGTAGADTAATDLPAARAYTKTILFFGNSLTAGYGLDPEQAFPALIQQKIDSLNLPYRVVNGGLSGETTTGGLARIDFMLRQPVDVLVIELGGNDGLRGIQPNLARQNLQGIIDKARAKYPAIKIVLAGMEAPPSMGQDYTQAFRQLYPALAQKNQVTLIPFLLEKVGGIPDLNLPDGIHPTAQGHQLVAETVWQILRPVL
ncbi:MAG: arylesterase [Bernardetiaceae bacterium]|nr:arylesterase [Bernardetiaceae bacterium]